METECNILNFRKILAFCELLCYNTITERRNFRKKVIPPEMIQEEQI